MTLLITPLFVAMRLEVVQFALSRVSFCCKTKPVLGYGQDRVRLPPERARCSRGAQGV